MHQIKTDDNRMSCRNKDSYKMHLLALQVLQNNP